MFVLLAYVLNTVCRIEAAQRVQQRSRQQHSLLFVGKLLHLAREFARILGQYSHAFRNGYEVDIEEAALTDDLHGLVAHDRQRPEHQDETGFLLHVLDQNGDTPLTHEVRIRRRRNVLLFDDLCRIRSHNGNVESVHDDDGNDQREHLEDELNRNVFLIHRAQRQCKGCLKD